MHLSLAPKGSFWNYLSHGGLNFPPHFANLLNKCAYLLHLIPVLNFSQARKSFSNFPQSSHFSLAHFQFSVKLPDLLIFRQNATHC